MKKTRSEKRRVHPQSVVDKGLLNAMKTLAKQVEVQVVQVLGGGLPK